MKKPLTIFEIAPKWAKRLKKDGELTEKQVEQLGMFPCCVVGEAQKGNKYFMQFVKNEKNPGYCRSCTVLAGNIVNTINYVLFGTGTVCRDDYNKWVKKFERHWNKAHRK